MDDLTIVGTAIRTEALAGSRIDQVCTQLCELSDLLGLYVLCEFNGVQLTATPDAAPELLCDHYYKRIGKDAEGA